MFNNWKRVNGKGTFQPVRSGAGDRRRVDDALREAVANEVIDQVNREFPVEVLALARRGGSPAHPGAHQRCWLGWLSGATTPIPATRPTAHWRLSWAGG